MRHRIHCVLFMFWVILLICVDVGICRGVPCLDVTSLDFKNREVEITGHGKVRFEKGNAFTSDGGETKDWKHRIVQDDIVRPEASNDTLRLIKIESSHTTGSGFWEHVIIFKCRRGDVVEVFHKSFLGGVKIEHDLEENFMFISGEWSKDDPACCPSKKNIVTYHWNKADELFELMYPPVAESEIKNWKTVQNKDRSFQLLCPMKWTVVEYGSDFHLRENDSFAIRVQSIDNPTSLSSFELFRKIEQEENSGAIGGLRYSDLVQEKIGGLEAVTLKDVFTYDSGAEMTYIAVGNKAFVLSFTSMSAEEVEHREELDKHGKMNAIARSIIRTFKVVAPAVPESHKPLR